MRCVAFAVACPLTDVLCGWLVLQLEQRDDGDEIQDALASLTGGRTVPRVFIGGEFLGGGDDTARAASNGQLTAMLKNKGIM